MDTNVGAFLDMIAKCEGTGPFGYNILFGGKTFADYSTHPNIKTPFTQTDGTTNYSSAAGRYQIIFPTWKRLCAKLGLRDFSKTTQDIMAMELIAEDGAMADVKSGNIAAAIDKCSGTWASLPSSKYPQPKHTLEYAQSAYVDAGGIVA